MTTTQKFLKYSIIGGLFLIPFIPFLVPKTMFFPFITGKGFVFRLLVGLITAMFTSLAFIDSSYRPKFSLITKSLLIFGSIVMIANIFGENPYKSFWSNYERMEGFVLIFHLILYYFVLSSFLNTKELWDKFLNVNVFAGLLMSIYGLFQIFGKFTINQGGTRVDGTFGNAAYLAIYLVFNIFLCLYLSSQKSIDKYKKYTYLLIGLLHTFVLYYTATRGAILGFIGGLFLTTILIVWKERENKLVQNISKYSLITLILLVVLFGVFKDTDFIINNKVLSRFSNLSLSEFKTQGRYYVWPMAIEGIKEKPILGWGQENFNFVFNKNYNPGLFGQEEWFDRTHNVVLDWLIAGGILGFLAYLSIYISLVYYIWRKESDLTNSEKSILTGVVSAYVFHNMFVFDNLFSYVMFFNILALVHYKNSKSFNSESKFYKESFSNDSVNYVILPIVFISFALFIYYINLPAYLTNKSLIKAMTPQKSGVKENIKYYKEALSYNSFGQSEVLEQLVTYASQNIASPNINNEDKQEFYNLANERIIKKIKEVPNDARYLVFAGSFYNRVGQYDKAIEYLEKALKESPLKQTIHFELGTSYLGKGDVKKMSELFKKAYDLKPEARESRILYAISAIYNRDNETLKELAKVIEQDTVIFDDRFFRSYFATGDYNSALNILNARIQRQPNEIQHKLTLASFYSTIGQKQNAIQVIQSIISSNPEFREQGESYIKQIQNS